MNGLCTLYISGKKFGTINTLQLSKDQSNSPSIYFISDWGNSTRIDLQVIDNEVPDEPLRKLSSTEYLITTQKNVIYKDRKYRFFGELPTACQYKAIPISKSEVVDYSPKNDIEIALLSEGYAHEVKDSQYILIPPSVQFSNTFHPYDVFVKGKDNDTYIFHSGRVPDKLDIDRIDGKYIYLKSIPTFTGDIVEPPFTYTTDTLVNKYIILQERLQKYGKQRVQSLCTAMRSLSQRISQIQDQFKASNVYDDVVMILDRVRNM